MQPSCTHFHYLIFGVKDAFLYVEIRNRCVIIDFFTQRQILRKNRILRHFMTSLILKFEFLKNYISYEVENFTEASFCCFWENLILKYFDLWWRHQLWAKIDFCLKNADVIKKAKNFKCRLILLLCRIFGENFIFVPFVFP